jgi:hypothetical protein
LSSSSAYPAEFAQMVCTCWCSSVRTFAYDHIREWAYDEMVSVMQAMHFFDDDLVCKYIFHPELHSVQWDVHRPPAPPASPASLVRTPEGGSPPWWGRRPLRPLTRFTREDSGRWFPTVAPSLPPPATPNGDVTVGGRGGVQTATRTAGLLQSTTTNMKTASVCMACSSALCGCMVRARRFGVPRCSQTRIFDLRIRPGAAAK